jgi:hypothetical protein
MHPQRSSVKLSAAFLAIGVFGILCGCKLTRWKQTTQQSDSGAAAAQVGVPQRTSDSDQTGATFDVDEKTGHPKINLVLRLDYFPPAQPGAASLPACFNPLPVDFDLGTVQCADNPAEAVQLTAGNVEQDCYTDPKSARTPPQDVVELDGCKHGVVLVHSFNPPLRIDTEVRDVN